MPLGIRPACIGDAADLSALMIRAICLNNAVDYPADVIGRLVRRHSPEAVATMIATRRVFLASEGGRLVGTVALENDVLRGLFVDVGRQGLSHATVLVRWVENLARSDGLAGLSLRSSITAHGFYERLGYRTQSFGFHPDGSTYLMVKRLQADPHQIV